MKKIFFLILVAGQLLCAQDSSLDWNFSFGLGAGLETVTLESDSNLLYDKNLSYGALVFDVTYKQRFFFGLGVGLNGYKLREYIDFTGLPLSLRLGDESFGGLLLQLRLGYDLFDAGYFRFLLNGRLTYLLEKKKEWPVTLPAVEGNAAVSESMFLANFELLSYYQGISAVYPFLGVGAQFAGDRYKASEAIADISAEEVLLLKGKSIVNFLAGVEAEVGEHLLVGLKGFLGASRGLSLSLKYEI